MKKLKLLISSMGLREYELFEKAFSLCGCMTETADYSPSELLVHAKDYDGVIFSFDILPYENAKPYVLNICSNEKVKLVFGVTCYTDFDHIGISGINDKLVLLLRPLYQEKVVELVRSHFPAVVTAGISDPLIVDEIERTLHYIGYSITQTGYSALRDGLIYMVENKCLTASLSKEIYPYLEERSGQNIAAIEKAIRCLNGRIWRKAPESVVEKFFPGSGCFTDKVPGNKKIFAAIAKVITENLSDHLSEE